jgi:hypothetical protein
MCVRQARMTDFRRKSGEIASRFPQAGASLILRQAQDDGMGKAGVL